MVRIGCDGHNHRIGCGGHNHTLIHFKTRSEVLDIEFSGAMASDLSVNQHATHVINSYYSVDCVHHIGCLEIPVRILLDVSKQPSNVCL